MVDKNNIQYDAKEHSADIKEIIREIKEFRYEDNLKEVTHQLQEFDVNFSKKVLTIDERVNILSRLHLMRDVSGWVIGDILLREENKIKEDVLEWENHKRPNPPKYRTLFDFIKEHEDRLGFGKSTAYDYIRIRKNASVDTFLKLGVRKTLVILKIKDEELALKITESAIKHNWTLEKLKEKYIHYIENEKQQNNVEFNSMIKGIDKKIQINTHLKGRNIKDNEMLLSFSSAEERNDFNEILQNILPKIKLSIYKKSKKKHAI